MKRINLLVGIFAVFFSTNSNAQEDSWGTVVHVPSDEILDIAQELGAPWVRITDIWSAHQNPCTSNIRFNQAIDHAIQGAMNRGLLVYLSLGATPSCASVGDQQGDGSHNDVFDAGLWASYVRQAVRHYRPMGVVHFGLSNEANLRAFWEGNVDQASDIIYDPGIRAVRDGCAEAGYDDCLALGPELASIGSFDKFLEKTLKTLKARGLEFDIFTHHVYQGFHKRWWDKDNFYNAFEKRRFFFTRRSFVDTLQDAGFAPGHVPNREVWLTETGYRCKPPTDPKEMEKQRSYIRNVLEEQQKRSWWTRSFFYQLPDSYDQIDGYGIVRKLDDGTWFFKPAFFELQNWVEGH